MRCERCGTENRAGASFCMSCGNRFALACASCGRGLPADARFCDSCGSPVATAAAPGDTAPTASERPAEAAPPSAPAPPPHLAARILRDRAALQGERRTVTVLFIDAVASTARSENVDPEALHRTIHACTERMIDAVNRFEGAVTQFRGDGVMALFGAPIAHEDSARRAVSAALAMRDDLASFARDLAARGQPYFEYRIGLHTGSVVVGVIGNDLTMDYTAVGDTVNLAARMEQIAAPGTVCISEATRRSVEGYFETRDLGFVGVKGKAEPVHAHEVICESAARSRLDATAARGLTPYVGRDLQLSLLHSLFERASAGEGQVALISGEAGMGKSRLMLEFRQSLGERAGWLEGRCISWGRTYPYLPIVDVVRAAIGVRDVAGEDATARIDAAIEAWGARPADLAPHVRYLLGGASADVAEDSGERHARILDALRYLARHASAERPLVLAFEDIHWADEPSEEAIAALVDAVEALPVLLMLTHRPDHAHGLAEREYFTRIELRNLPAEGTAAMVSGLLETGGIPLTLQQLIAAKSDGNPFFVEEVTRELLESGVLRRESGTYTLARDVAEVRIPGTVHEVILSRLDRLPARAREAVQRAAVIGREFPLALLERVEGGGSAGDGLGETMRALMDMGLVYEQPRDGGGPAYMFKHALTQDVALSTLLGERRRELHRAVASAIEEVYAGAADHDEALAQHAYEGGDWQKAADYSLRVALRAQSLHAPRAVIEHVSRAIAAASMLDMPVDPLLHRMRAAAHERIGEFTSAREDYERSAELAAAAGDAESEWKALAGLGMLWAGRDYARTGEYFERAHALAQRMGDRRTIGRSLNRLANWYLNQDDTRRAIRLHEEALDIFIELGDRRGLAETYDFLNMANGIAGDARASARYGAQALALYRELDDRQALAGILPSLAMCGPQTEMETCLPIEDADLDVLSMCDEAITIARDIGFRSGEAYGYMQRSVSLAAFGEYGPALDAAMKSLTLAREIGHTQWQLAAWIALAYIFGELGDYRRGREACDEAIILAEEVSSPHWNRLLCGQIASGCAVLGSLDDARAAIARAGVSERLDDPQTMDSVGKRQVWAGRADIAIAEGDPRRAIAILDQLGATSGTGAAAYEDPVLEIPLVALRRSRAYLALGDLPAAERDARAAHAVAVRYHMRGATWRTLSQLADVLDAASRPDEARAAREEALALIDALAAPISDSAIRESFLASDHVTRLRAALE